MAAAACLIAASLPTRSNASDVYVNDFESGDTTGWSTTTAPGPWANPIQTEVTPVGARRFLGQFGKQDAALSLTGLQTHSWLFVEFDLFVIRTWDGNMVPTIGPDVLDVTVTGGPNLIHTTFNNGHGAVFAYGQAYPGSFPGGVYAPWTGAEEVQSIGYSDNYGSGVQDSVYHLEFWFQHTDPSVELVFTGALSQPSAASQVLDDESWGLDNVRVSAVPEPSSLLILGALIGLTPRRKR